MKPTGLWDKRTGKPVTRRQVWAWAITKAWRDTVTDPQTWAIALVAMLLVALVLVLTGSPR